MESQIIEPNLASCSMDHKVKDLALGIFCQCAPRPPEEETFFPSIFQKISNTFPLCCSLILHQQIVMTGNRKKTSRTAKKTSVQTATRRSRALRDIGNHAEQDSNRVDDGNDEPSKVSKERIDYITKYICSMMSL